ncbi:MAG TPA: redoxin family protein [Thermoanaerobaculia bacterium]|nr:redoxin family protein [Thermoanaerobaculia bacterium]
MTRRLHSGLAVLGGLALSLASPSLQAPAATAEERPPAYAQKLAEGKDLLDDKKYYEAVKALREADKLANGSCLECHLALARAYNKLGAWRDGLKQAEAALGMTSDRSRLAEAYNERGIALLAMAGDDMKQLAEAEKGFRQVLELTGGEGANAARFNLGYTLLRMSRDDEGVAALKAYLEQEPQGPFSEDARDLIETPLRARKRLIPDFELVTLDGSFMTSDDLRGKVVLLDFWGTWCPPCVAAVPTLRTWSQRREKDPFVLVSVSTDTDEAALRAFVAKNKMQWPQVWDGNHLFTSKCKVDRFPTYLLVSHEGEIVYKTSGWGPGIEEELRGKIFFAIRAAKESAKSK